MNFEKNINALVGFIIESKKIKAKNNINQTINRHFRKIDFIVKTAIILDVIILNLFSFFFYQRFFNNLTNIEIKKIIKKSSFFFNFLTIKSLEALHALICIHVFNDEKIEIKKVEAIQKNFYEFIVIGSGPGGSITANKLNKNFPDKTLLIDKGQEFNTSKTKHSGEEFYYKWANGGVASSLYPYQINFSSGSCIGGGSEINSGLYHEPDSDFLNKWIEKYETKNLQFEQLKEFIDEINKYLKPSVSSQNSLFEKNFKLGADLTKKKFQNIPRLSYKDKTHSVESTMLNTYLKDYKENRGDILRGLNIVKILQVKDGWRIEGYLDQEKKYLKCKYLFLCCGSIYTNSLLLNSLKFKNKKSITKFNFHPMIKIIAKYPNKIQNINEDVSALQITSHHPEFIIGNAASSKQFMLASVFENKEIYDDILNNWEYMSIYHATFSFGNGNIFKLPILKKDLFFYHIKESNLHLILRSLKEMCNFVFKSGASEIILISTKEKKKVSLKNFNEVISSFKKVKDFIFSSVHILGGVTMGEKKGCITDSYGKVKEYNNLYVNDSSLINNKLLKNPQGAVMAVACRNIENFIRNYKNFEKV